MGGRPVEIGDRGGWWLARGRPHPALRPFLRSYDGYWEQGGVPGRTRTLPGGTATVILNLGPPLYLRFPDPGAGARHYGSFVAGLYDGPGGYEHPGGLRGVQLDITPLGCYTLLGVPMGRLTNAAAELPDLLGPSAARLVERLAEAPSWAARFDLLDAFLLARLEAGPAPDPEVAHAWRLLAAGGGITVAALAAEVGWSRGHLARRFRDQAGLPPKAAARVLRFERAVAMLSDGADLAGTASACGYYDQAHLSRDFRALGGGTPTALIAELLGRRRGSTLAEPV
ncbi:helix-turn-helix domain-containing protein [Spirillospora albida]|uniref:helix-turn-helix domain-containing protein n=1 Tax=Spirillospora albida TaxID=58123 RepID=UPI000A06790C|nr:AraC family transcriptional regulator [Spirillospora albida]